MNSSFIFGSSTSNTNPTTTNINNSNPTFGGFGGFGGNKSSSSPGGGGGSGNNIFGSVSSINNFSSVNRNQNQSFGTTTFSNAFNKPQNTTTFNSNNEINSTQNPPSFGVFNSQNTPDKGPGFGRGGGNSYNNSDTQFSGGGRGGFPGRGGRGGRGGGGRWNADKSAATNTGFNVFSTGGQSVDEQIHTKGFVKTPFKQREWQQQPHQQGFQAHTQAPQPYQNDADMEDVSAPHNLQSVATPGFKNQPWGGAKSSTPQVPTGPGPQGAPKPFQSRPPRTFACKVCNSEFPTRPELYEHLAKENHFTSGGKPRDESQQPTTFQHQQWVADVADMDMNYNMAPPPQAPQVKKSTMPIAPRLAPSRNQDEYGTDDMTTIEASYPPKKSFVKKDAKSSKTMNLNEGVTSTPAPVPADEVSDYYKDVPVMTTRKPKVRAPKTVPPPVVSNTLDVNDVESNESLGQVEAEKALRLKALMKFADRVEGNQDAPQVESKKVLKQRPVAAKPIKEKPIFSSQIGEKDSPFDDISPKFKEIPAKQFKNEVTMPPPTSQFIPRVESQPMFDENEDSGEVTLGICEDMCPYEECVRRINQNDVHIFESGADSDYTIETLKNTMVKQYQRSAADHTLSIPSLIRTPNALLKTMDYLEDNIISLDLELEGESENSAVSLLDVYLFTWNRMRMVAKDFILQNYRFGGRCDAASIECHERMARWHIMMGHKLIQDEDFVKVHAQQNDEQMNKVLKSLRELYDEAASLRQKGIGFETPNEAEFRAYYVLYQLDNEGEAEKYLASLTKEVLRKPHMQFALKVVRTRRTQNFATFFRMLRECNYLQACSLFKYIGFMRLQALRVLSRALRAGKNESYYPLDDMIRLLVFEDEVDALTYLNHCGLEVIDNDEGTVIVFDNRNIVDQLPVNKKTGAPILLPTCQMINGIESKMEGYSRADVCRGLLSIIPSKGDEATNSTNELPRKESIDLTKASSLQRSQTFTPTSILVTSSEPEAPIQLARKRSQQPSLDSLMSHQSSPPSSLLPVSPSLQRANSSSSGSNVVAEKLKNKLHSGISISRSFTEQQEDGEVEEAAPQTFTLPSNEHSTKPYDIEVPKIELSVTKPTTPKKANISETAFPSQPIKPFAFQTQGEKKPPLLDFTTSTLNNSFKLPSQPTQVTSSITQPKQVSPVKLPIKSVSSETVKVPDTQPEPEITRKKPQLKKREAALLIESCFRIWSRHLRKRFFGKWCQFVHYLRMLSRKLLLTRSLRSWQKGLHDSKERKKKFYESIRAIDVKVNEIATPRPAQPLLTSRSQQKPEKSSKMTILQHFFGRGKFGSMIPMRNIVEAFEVPYVLPSLAKTAIISQQNELLRSLGDACTDSKWRRDVYHKVSLVTCDAHYARKVTNQVDITSSVDVTSSFVSSYLRSLLCYPQKAVKLPLERQLVGLQGLFLHRLPNQESYGKFTNLLVNDLIATSDLDNKDNLPLHSSQSILCIIPLRNHHDIAILPEMIKSFVQASLGSLTRGASLAFLVAMENLLPSNSVNYFRKHRILLESSATSDTEDLKQIGEIVLNIIRKEIISIDTKFLHAIRIFDIIEVGISVSPTTTSNHDSEILMLNEWCQDTLHELIPHGSVCPILSRVDVINWIEEASYQAIWNTTFDLDASSPLREILAAIASAFKRCTEAIYATYRYLSSSSGDVIPAIEFYPPIASNACQALYENISSIGGLTELSSAWNDVKALQQAERIFALCQLPAYLPHLETPAQFISSLASSDNFDYFAAEGEESLQMTRALFLQSLSDCYDCEDDEEVSYCLKNWFTQLLQWRLKKLSSDEDDERRSTDIHLLTAHYNRSLELEPNNRIFNWRLNDQVRKRKAPSPSPVDIAKPPEVLEEEEVAMECEGEIEGEVPLEDVRESSGKSIHQVLQDPTLPPHIQYFLACIEEEKARMGELSSSLHRLSSTTSSTIQEDNIINVKKRRASDKADREVDINRPKHGSDEEGKLLSNLQELIERSAIERKLFEIRYRDFQAS